MPPPSGSSREPVCVWARECAHAWCAGCFVLWEAQTSHACPHIGRLWGHTWNGWTLIMSFWLQLRSCRGILCESELI